MTEPPSTTPDPGRSRYRLGDLLIDTGPQRITRGFEVIALPRLSYDLLLTLIRAAPDLVSNDALMEQVWPKLVVSPETVSQRVKLLRDALGDDPRNPRYIEGLRGRGYRLIPTVQIEPGSAAAPRPALAAEENAAIVTEDVRPSLPPPSLSTRRTRFTRWVPAASIGLVVLIAILAAVYAVRKPAATPTRTSVEVVATQPRAIAVLPFDNLSAEPGNEYIALGIAESVLNRLGGIRQLIVISRSSSFGLGKPTPDARTAGQRLGVQYVVEGSIQRSGSKLRVNAQLIDTTNNRELWSLTFDRGIDDVFAVQDEIARNVGDKLDVTLNGQSTPYSTYGTEAYLAYLKGRELVETRKIDSVAESIRQFSDALKLAPTFAGAMVELGFAKLLLPDLLEHNLPETDPLWSEIKALADQAVMLEPNSGEPYYLRGVYKLGRDRDTAGAEADFQKGLQLSPGYEAGVDTVISYWSEHNRLADASALIERAAVLNPLSPRLFYLQGEMLRQGYSDWKRAADSYLRALSLAPDFYPALLRLAQVRANEGRIAEAIQYGEKSLSIEPGVRWTRERLVWFYVDIGDLDAARDVRKGYAPGVSAEDAENAMICLRAGNLALADTFGRRALRSRHSQLNAVAFVLSAQSVVEQALATHAPAAAQQALLAIPGLQLTDGTIAVVDDNFPIVVNVAVLERAAGHATTATELATRILAYLNDPSHRDLPTEDDRERAAALALLGRNEEALTHLEDWAHKAGHMRWWDTLLRDPTFEPLRANPRFQTLRSEAQVWLADQQRQLKQLRDQGVVPQRSTPKSAGTC